MSSNESSNNKSVTDISESNSGSDTTTLTQKMLEEKYLMIEKGDILKFFAYAIGACFAASFSSRKFSSHGLNLRGSHKFV